VVLPASAAPWACGICLLPVPSNDVLAAARRNRDHACPFRSVFSRGACRIIAQPSPLSAPGAADEVAAAMEAGSRAKSFVIVNGTDRSTSAAAVMSVRSWRSTGLPWVRASHGPDDSK
jgi:hypothetical protein